jgi:hypothetical protein
MKQDGRMWSRLISITIGASDDSQFVAVMVLIITIIRIEVMIVMITIQIFIYLFAYSTALKANYKIITSKEENKHRH